MKKITSFMIEYSEIKKIIPCIADSEKIRVIAKFDKNLSEVLPYLNVEFPTATYSEKLGILCFKKGRQMITLYSSGKVMMTQMDSEQSVREFLEELRHKINAIYERRDEIDVSKFRKKIRISPFDLFPYLPKTNCRDCGEKTCTAFSMKIIEGVKNLKECPHLEKENEDILSELLKSVGYENV